MEEWGKKCVFSQKTWRQETTCETKAQMRGY
jgi:hypothetical protein